MHVDPKRTAAATEGIPTIYNIYILYSRLDKTNSKISLMK